ncbi:MAG: HD-GYP domain-containing protein [Campylobacterota bacterium]|nr:HD-GYP domain-containing protein [Campylobacterota bacterium]
MGYKKIKLSHASLKTLEPYHQYNYPIYYKREPDNVFVKLLDSGDSFNTKIQNTIKEKNIKNIYVLYEDHEEYEHDIEEYLKKIKDDKNIPYIKKSEILHELASDVMYDMLDGELNPKKIMQANSVVNDKVDILLSDHNAVKAMLKVTSHDYYTYTHCVNVSTYSLGFGAFLKLTDKQLRIIGMAGMMHDLGKKQIPLEIINKKGKLSDDEFKTMKNHPTFGVDLLKELGETDKLLLDIVEQHHEKLNGTGYPHQLKAKEIHPYAKVMAICDIFDALTTKRSYKPAMKSYDAFSLMRHKMEHEIDQKLLEQFIKFMSRGSL